MRCDQDLIGAGQFGQRDDIHPRLHDLADLLILHVQDRLDHAPLARLDAFRARGRLQSADEAVKGPSIRRLLTLHDLTSSTTILSMSSETFLSSSLRMPAFLSTRSLRKVTVAVTGSSSVDSRLITGTSFRATYSELDTASAFGSSSPKNRVTTVCSVTRQVKGSHKQASWEVAVM